MKPYQAPCLHTQLQRDAENAAMAAHEKRLAPLFWLVFAAAAAVLIGYRIYDAGRAAAQHECPPAQQGERLLSIEQRREMTVCYYAAGSASYGHTVKQRKAKS